jgi:hypothetical protein
VNAGAQNFAPKNGGRSLRPYLICGVNSPPSLGAVDSPQSTAMRSENIHLHPLLASKINSGNIGKKRIFARKS